MKPENLIAAGFAGNPTTFLRELDDSDFEAAWRKEAVTRARSRQIEDGRRVSFVGPKVAGRHHPMDRWLFGHGSQGSDSTPHWRNVDVAVDQKDVPEQRHRTGQLNLWANQDFSPSSRLIGFWQDGLEFHAPKEQHFTLRSVSRLFEASTMRSEFADQLIGALVEELRFVQKSTSQSFELIDRNGDFPPFLEIRFSNLFPIRPKNISDFLTALSTELRDYFMSGGHLEASWGSIASRGQGVLIELRPKEVMTVPKSNKRVIKLQL